MPAGRALVLLLGVLAAVARAEGDCGRCHGTADDAGDPALVVRPEVWKRTVHGAADVDCSGCHAGHAEFPHEEHDVRTSCADCHADPVQGLAAGAHRRVEGGPPRPDCTECHGRVHAMARSDDVASPVHPARVAQTCAVCHADRAATTPEGVRLVQPVAAYTASVHARSLDAGKQAATCSSCHGTHEILSAAVPRSPVNRKNVPATCGQCHAEVARAFASSVHGVAAAHGIGDAPVCTDCHGEHRILGPRDAGSPVFASNVPKMACGRCHDDLRITEKFGMGRTQVAAFQDSFHGLAGKAGNVSVANCASCHGVHDILPSSDPRSHVHPANLPATCGTCHPGAGSTFAIGAVHALPGDRDRAHPAVYWVRLAYLVLIWVVISAMVVHNALDLRRKAVTAIPRSLTLPATGRPRMSAGFRRTHALLMVSFVLLVWSGFTLTYPEAWWATPLVAWETRLGLRGWLHRGAAVGLLAAAVIHVVHVAVDRRARACIRRMLPSSTDRAELAEKLGWLVGRRTEMPRAPLVGYVEKLEYLAVLWGTLIMAVSGFVLWFDAWSLAHLPKWVMDVATVVHFYEALLATLAILVWHLYSVVFDPLVYPMDSAWLTGREAPGRTWERTEPDAEE